MLRPKEMDDARLLYYYKVLHSYKWPENKDAIIDIYDGLHEWIATKHEVEREILDRMAK